MMYTMGMMVAEERQRLINRLDECAEEIKTASTFEAITLADEAMTIDSELTALLQMCPEAFESYEHLTSCFYDCQQCPYYEKDTNGCCMQCEEITGRDYIW